MSFSLNVLSFQCSSLSISFLSMFSPLHVLPSQTSISPPPLSMSIPLNAFPSQCLRNVFPSECSPLSMSSLLNVFFSRCLLFSVSSLLNVFPSQCPPFCPSQHQSPDPILLSPGRELQCRSCRGQYQSLDPNPLSLEWKASVPILPWSTPDPRPRSPFFLGRSARANPAPVLTPIEEAREVICGAIHKICRNGQPDRFVFEICYFPVSRSQKKKPPTVEFAQSFPRPHISHPSRIHTCGAPPDSNSSP